VLDLAQQNVRLRPDFSKVENAVLAAEGMDMRRTVGISGKY